MIFNFTLILKVYNCLFEDLYEPIMIEKQDPSFSPTTKLTATSLVLGFGIASLITARRNTMSRVRMMDVYGPSAHVKNLSSSTLSYQRDIRCL